MLKGVSVETSSYETQLGFHFSLQVFQHEGRGHADFGSRADDDAEVTEVSTAPVDQFLLLHLLRNEARASGRDYRFLEQVPL